VSFSRRQFVHRSALFAAAGLMPRAVWGSRAVVPALTGVSTARADRSVLRALALRAVDAARSAGATYADVRVIRSIEQSFSHERTDVVGCSVSDSERLGIGVRALVNGCWGFAATPYLEPDDAARAGSVATMIAKTNAAVAPRSLEWAPLPGPTGEWTSPIRIDPFSIPIEERIDFMNAWRQSIVDAPKHGVIAVPATSSMQFAREERIMVSSEGMDVVQTIYTTIASFRLEVAPRDWRAREEGKGAQMRARGLGARQAGWELMLDARLRDQVPRLLDDGRELISSPEQPTQAGRYDVVFDSPTMASLLGYTIGLSTELDRALGDEANASGTSFLGPAPIALLGTQRLGAPSVTVTANRSAPGGVATVKWDDEGVVPETFTLVTNGVLTDYQTTREQASLLAPWYRARGKPVRSNGCASASWAFGVPMSRVPNLALEPSKGTSSFADLVAGTKRGLAIMGADVSTDFQARRGWTDGGRVRLITNGKLGPRLSDAGAIFSTVELWKSITALGGHASIEPTTLGYFKGQPGIPSQFTVAAPAACATNISVIDTRRLA